MQINDIGHTLEMPTRDDIQSHRGIRKEPPTNREPKDRVKAAAWLYAYLKKTDRCQTKEVDFTSLPGISGEPFERLFLFIYLISSNKLKVD